ncbi:MAG: activator of Hsp90 ATPase 1 family protein [Ignavibacteria bacterium]|nr:activator of Hsp90 ATPase 1 family protein [Ignavibacteria bacterium]
MFELKNNYITKQEQAEFVLTRVFNAPRTLVFDALTNLNRLKKWWGPQGFKWVDGTLDLRSEGMFHYCLRSLDGIEMWGKFVFREIVENERLTYIASFSDKEGNTIRHFADDTWPRSVLMVINFQEHEGKTILSMHGIPVNASDREIDTYASCHQVMKQDFKGTFNQLDEYLSEVIVDIRQYF